jgi:predicted secreted protein
MTIKGKDLMLFVAGKSIALATSHTMTVDGDIKEITNKDSGGNWTENELNMLSWSG